MKKQTKRKKGLERIVWCAMALMALAIVAMVLWMGLFPVKKDRSTTAGAPATLPIRQAQVDTQATEADVPPETEVPPQEEEVLLPPVQPVDPNQARQRAEEILAEMSDQEKVYQLFVVTPEQLVGQGSTVTQTDWASERAIENKPVGGIIYFSPNLQTPNQTRKMILQLQTASKLGLFISVDEEGGSVVRIADNPSMGTTWFSAMGEISGTDEAYQVGKTIGTEIAGLGFNLDFAPVADVFSNPSNTVIGNRAFSTDPQETAQLVAACVEGFRESGILCTLKHFPGHGDTGTDSHYGAAESTKTLEELEVCEFLPFQAGIEAGAQVVMVGHVTLPNVTQEDLPATLSQEIVDGILRQQLGFEGLVITDAMNMGAITNHYSSGQATVLALDAGVDMILMPSDLGGAVDGVLDALDSGELTWEQIDEKLLRILTVKVEQGIIS